MSPSIYALVCVAFVAIAVTVYAYLSAKNGFEDQFGFHTVRLSRRAKERAARSDDEPKDDSSLPPLMTAH